MEQQLSKNPKAGYESFFTNYKQDNSARKGQASSSGQRRYEVTSRTLKEPSSPSASSHERNNVKDTQYRYTSAPLYSQGFEQVNPRSKSQPTADFKSKEYGLSGSQSYPSSERSNNSELDIAGTARRSTREERSVSGLPWIIPGEVVSGRTEVEWEKQRVQEMNMEWRQGHEKWRTRAEEVMQGYARELEKSLKEFPDALLKCP